MPDFQSKGPVVARSVRANGSGSASPLSRRATAMQQFPVFATLSASEFKEVTSAAHEKLLPRRETIYNEGDPIREVFLLTAGCVKVTQLGPNGQEVILRLHGPSELIGAQGLSAGKLHLATARAIQTSTALVWEASVFESISDRIPSLRRNTARILGERLQEMEERFREISTQKVASRLSHQLIRLLNQLGRGTDHPVEIGLSREELAQLTGTTLFTVSRLLSQWEKQGIISSRREAVVVCNVEALAALSEED